MQLKRLFQPVSMILLDLYFPKHNFSLPLHYRWLLNRAIKVTVLPFRAEVLPEIVDIENLSFPCVTRLEGSPFNNVEPSALRVFLQACPRLEILMDSHLGPNCEAVVQYIASLARERSLRYLLSLGLAYGSKYFLSYQWVFTGAV
eukprot:gene5764-6348_t